MTDSNIKLLYIDLFCGAGGTSTGVEYATANGNKCAKVIACVNHDANAIASHAANHPDAQHFTEDIRTLELSPLVKKVQESRAAYPNAQVVLWASLECTNFSKAKGGMPRDADSRTLAEHLFRYIQALQPDYIQIENVEEFMSWGDMDANGRPISKDKGKSYVRWVNNVCKYGYYFDWRILNAADYGAYTSRRRYFGQFARHGLPIVFPKPTHVKCPDKGKNTLFPNENLKQWKPVREVLNLEDEGESIFGRKKPLVEKTLERIYAGLVKFVAGGKEEFLVRYNTVKPQHTVKSLDEPCGVLTCDNRFAKTKVQFLSKQYSGDPKGKNISIEQPAGIVTCRDHHAFVSAYYGNGFNTSIDVPAPTLTTKDRLGLVTSNFLNMQYGNGTPSGINEPAPAVTTNPKHNLVCVKPWIMNTNFGNVGSSVDEPAQVITANRKWHYLMNPQFACKGGSIDKPCFTLIARMDKMPPYLISTKEGFAIEVYETDSPVTARIKEFMALYGIADIRMRMLRINELKRIMGFPEDYTLIGTQAEQKKFIGNAVEVNMARVLCAALCNKL